jgi:HD-GYP domain-containing protein (c-di-GMP phosphodiesterase class II)
MNIDSYDSPEAEALLEAGATRQSRPLEHRREVTTRMVAAFAFLAAAGVLAAVVPWHRSLSLPRLAVVLVAYVAADRIKFPVAGGFTYPTMLVFVPMLFILPTPFVPLAVMTAILVGGSLRFVRRQAPLSRIPSYVADSWYSVGPALVIVLGGAERFSWSHWPIYAAALLAQFALDMVVTVGRCWLGEGISPRVQVPLLMWVYLVDAMLAPLGLLIAASAATRPALLLLALPVLGMLWLFARERQQRLEQTRVLSSAYRGTALLLGEVIEADDHYTGFHSREVVDLSLALADALGLDALTRRNIEFTALLHDVGKIHIPKEILNKPGSLNDDEWALMRGHTIEGQRMLRHVGGALANIGMFVRSSHEHFDGSGYPDGLAGEQIPVESRVVTLCDAYNAMTTNRPYRTAMTHREALEEMRRVAGDQFDPRMVAAFERLDVGSAAGMQPHFERSARAAVTEKKRAERTAKAVASAGRIAQAFRVAS